MLKWKLSRYGLMMVVLALSGCKVKVPESAKLRCVAEPLVQETDSGESFDVRVTVTGGEKPYFLLGASGTFDTESVISRSFENEADAMVDMTGTVIVNDNIGFTTQCSYQVAVNPADDTDPDVASLSTVATPAASVSSASTITITAIADGVGNSPSFTFAYTEAGVDMQQAGNQAIFSATDGESHSFDVTVTVNGAGETASKVVSLTFVKPTAQTLDCELTHIGDEFEVGDSVEFMVTAENNEPLEIFPQNPGASGTVLSNFGRHFTVRYATAGMKTVTVFAKSATSGIWCNNQAALTDMVDIDPIVEPTPTPTPDPEPVEYSCTAHVDDNMYRTWCGNNYPDNYGGYWNSVLTWATISGNPVGNVRIVDVDINNNGDGSYNKYYDQSGIENPLAKEVFVETQGNYRLTLKVQDAEGNQATCKTPQFQVWDFFGECTVWAY